ncbi:MAG: NADH:ubiquinone oxidoreductase [Planctomycetes bacterium]|nr:NADH:ubiquinone oxidoreductase [Planctomycetota bacterium]
MKPRIAIFSLTGCEGCSLAILELEDQLLAVLDAVEIVNFREGMTERAWDIDIGFVDGAVSTPGDEAEIRHYRESCKVLVAIGACACLGGINTLKNHQLAAEYRGYVYGERAAWFPTTAARPIAAVVKVDYELPGCPMVKEEFLRFVKHLLAGRQFRLPDYAVCVECKKRGNPCLYDRGVVCLGPMTRAGCDAICPTYGSKCEACRGIVSPEALAAAALNLRDQYHVPQEEVLAGLRLYGAYQEEKLP